MMSVETPWPAPVAPAQSGARWLAAAELEHDCDLAERVLAAGDRVDAELAQPRLAPGGGVDGAEDRVDRAVAGEVAAARSSPSGVRIATVACGGRRVEASTSNHSSV